MVGRDLLRRTVPRSRLVGKPLPSVAAQKSGALLYDGQMSWQFELIDGPYGGVSEGPAWDGSALLFTHIQQSRIMKYDPKTGAVSVFRENTNCANGLNFDRQGR